MVRARVLFVAYDEDGFTDERVKRVADHHFKRQTSDIMSPLRGKAAWAGKQSTRAPVQSAGVVGTARRERWFVVRGGDPLGRG